MLSALFIVVTISFALTADTVAAENWPQFRGQNGNGHSSSSVPISWSETNNVAWKVPIRGTGHSSPVVFDGQVWLTTADQNGKKLFAICIDADTGKTIHDLEVFEVDTPQHVHTTNTHASPTAVVEKGRVYLHYGSYGTACVDTRSGETLWTRRDLIVDHRHGPGSSPILVGDLLVLQFDGLDQQFMVTLNKRTGDTVWRKKRDIQYNSDNGERKKSFCTPLLVHHQGVAQIVTVAARSAIAYDPSSGDVLWRVRFIGDSATARPIYGENTLFITTSCIDAKLIAIRPELRGDITDKGVLWIQDKGIPQRPSSLFIDGLLYGIHDTGVLTCRDSKTGAPVWRRRLGGNFAASPVFAGGLIYFPNDDGVTHVVRPGRTFESVSINKLDDGGYASPAVANESIYLRTRKNLYRLTKR